MSTNLTTYFDLLRKQVMKYPITKEYSVLIEKKSGLNVEYIISGLALIPIIFVLYGIGAGFICNLVGFIYPLYATIKCIGKKTFLRLI